MSGASFRVVRVESWPADVALTDPFVVATGSRPVAEIAFLRVTLAGGARGYGEMAPFPEVGGEDRASCLAAAGRLARAALGTSALEYRRLGRLFAEMEPGRPAARCGLESALLDALCRAAGLPLWGFWGGADVRERETDITIPIADAARTVALARGWHARGFRLFKTKVGADLDRDLRRLEALHRALPDISIIADANQGFTAGEALTFARGVGRFGGRLVLLEQPVPREDLEGMAALRREAGVPVAADESVRSLADARRLVKAGAADVVNVKITKSGLLEATAIAGFARASGLGLMAGGMVETRLAMGCSFGLVLGLGGFDWLDLDTPLLLAADPVKGGFRYEGPRLLPWAGAGLDLEVAGGPVTTVE